ncbi:44426_t:CDS:2 [Gigaspora margarita]|uniref:44426_t:CDS:1 n=1 Tax=Gigaspora margarita TaxID=4874 RepID=A0ABM8VVL9_GIGMA|nr:44426_t:CDS:2 [Gigaspora margarita]
MVGRLGEIRYSILNQEQFQELYGKEWILMDGSSIFGSDLEKKFGWTSVSDLRGLFLRCKNNGRNDGLENPSGELALGQYHKDNLKSHNQVGFFVNNIEGQWGQSAYQGEFSSHRIANQGYDSTRSFIQSCEGLKYEISQYFNNLEQSHQEKLTKYLNKSDKQDPLEAFRQLIKLLLLPNKTIDDLNLLEIFKGKLPDANDDFNSVMKRIEFNGHPLGISANLFYLATLITHISYNDIWLLQSMHTGTGNQISLNFNYVYQWHSAITEDDAIWVEKKIQRNSTAG